MSTISRRAFLKTVGVGALSIAAVSVLAGCDTVPGTTEEVVAGTIKGTVGNAVPVDGKYTITMTGSSSEIAIDNTSKTWQAAYKKGFQTVITDDGANSTVEYSNATAEDIEKAVQAGLDEAADVAPVKQALTIKIANYSDNLIVLAQSVPTISSTDAKDLKSNTSVVTATCDGKEVACHVSTTTIAANDTTTGSVTCTLAVPANCEKIVVKVAVPGASKAVVYELTNSNYWSMTDCKAYNGV